MSPISRIHRLKTVILALIVLGLGIAMLTLANYSDGTPALQWLTYWPIAELGSILAGAGILGIGYNYLVDRGSSQVTALLMVQIGYCSPVSGRRTYDCCLSSNLSM